VAPLGFLTTAPGVDALHGQRAADAG